jgi:4-amino-4-deoxychorismate lyase
MIRASGGAALGEVWVNGRRGRTVDARDRGLQYGDGVFETMRVRRHAIRLLDFHLDRLWRSCDRLSLPMPDPHRLRKHLEGAAAIRREGVLKLIVTRGVGARGYRPTGHERGTCVLSAYPLSRRASSAVAAPVSVRLCTLRLGTNPLLAGLKSLNRLESVLARAEWSDPRLWEGLVRDTDDHIVCGTMSNVFLRRGSSLVTPLLDRCGVAGVMRRWVLEQAGALGLRSSERRLRWPDLGRAEEVFVTNAVVGVVPVAAIHDGRARIRLDQHLTADALRRRLEAV